MTMTDFVRSWIELRSITLQRSTIEGYKGICDKYISHSPSGSKEIQEITSSDIVAILAPIVAAGNTRQAQLTQILINAALKYAVKIREIEHNPADVLDKIKHTSKMTKWLEPDELAALIRAETRPMYRNAWILMGVYGLRRGECLGLYYTDIDDDCIHVRRQYQRGIMKTPKTASSIRDIPTPCRIIDRGIGRIVPVNENQITEALTTACSLAGVPRITPHGLRHSCAAAAAGAEVPIKSLQLILGHAHYGVTADVYTHVDRTTELRSMRRIMSRLEIV